jgi:hypothetical protein
VSHPYRAPTDHPGSVNSRRSRGRLVWLWILAPVVLAVLVLAIGALTRGEHLEATPVPTPSEPAAPNPPADAEGWQACQDLRELGAADLNHEVNRAIGAQARTSTDATLAARGEDLEDATRRAGDQDPIQGNLAISAAQVALRQACDQAFGPA